MKDIAVITGAASGIGFALAEKAAHNGYSLLLVDKNDKGLTAAGGKIIKEYPQVRVEKVTSDLTRPGAVEEIRKSVDRIGIVPGILINCAGFGVYGPFNDTDWEKEKTMINLHILASTHLIKVLLPGMIKNKRGRIMNVTSLAGFVPGPLMAVYYASKSYLISFSRALATELRNTGVTVTVLCPGLTQTGFSRKVHGQVSDIAKNKILSMNADKVADYAFKAMMKGKRVTVPGFMNKLFFVLAGILPVNLATNLVRRSQEKIGKEISTTHQ